MQIEVIHKKNYGRDFFYPVNEFGKTLCQLMDAASFTLEKLKICKRAGWQVEIKTEAFDLGE